jgi:hypothetical protein
MAERLVQLLLSENAFDDLLVISFDHVWLLALKERCPAIRTELITPSAPPEVRLRRRSRHRRPSRRRRNRRRQSRHRRRPKHGRLRQGLARPDVREANPGETVVAVGTGPGDAGSHKIYEKLAAQKQAGVDKWGIDVIVIHEKMAGQLLKESLLAAYTHRIPTGALVTRDTARMASVPTSRAS